MDLEGLLSNITRVGEIPRPPAGGRSIAISPSTPVRGPITKSRYTHDAMIDLLVANPGISQNALAAHFGYSASWVSTMMSGDMFKARLAERRKELVDPEISEAISVRMEGMVRRSMEVMAHKLDKDPDEIPDNFALRAFDLAGRMAGYGAKVSETKVQVNVETHLEALGENLDVLLRTRKAAIQGPRPSAPAADHFLNSDKSLNGDFNEITQDS